MARVSDPRTRVEDPGHTCCFDGNPRRLLALQPGMLTWAIIFGICSLIFGLLGFTGIAAGFATIARFLLALFLILLVLVLVFGGALFHAAAR